MSEFSPEDSYNLRCLEVKKFVESSGGVYAHIPYKEAMKVYNIPPVTKDIVDDWRKFTEALTGSTGFDFWNTKE